ncbi:annexin A13-like [Ptychodera flava]|uniref:annexin A13-like n=1 Tax=Ptychodera flava TaxID=63121 RepID=UPI00396A5DEB
MATTAPAKGKPNFDAKKAGERLHSSIDGINQVLLNVLTNTNSEERRELKYTYKTLYDKNLVNDIAVDTYRLDDFKKVCIGLLKTPAEFDAECARFALQAPSIDENALIDVICSSGTEEIMAMTEAYNKLYGRNLEEDVENGTKGDLQKVLVALLKPSRADREEMDFKGAKADAIKLYGGGKVKLGAEDSDFFNIMVTRSHTQLEFTLLEYMELSKRDILEVIDSDLSGTMAKAMKAIALFVTDKYKYYAYNLYKSMKGFGTSESILTHIIVKTNEYELPGIKKTFAKEYEESLTSWVEGDTSGYYRDILLALIGPDSGENTGK